MKLVKQYWVILLGITFLACQNQSTKRQTTNSADKIDNPAKESGSTADKRPKDETHFLNKVLAESDYDVTSNAVTKDSHIKAFNKYALDSLKNIKDWEFVVTEINDDSFSVNSFTKYMSNSGYDKVYNLLLTAPVEIDNSVDTIAMSNRVDFTYTIAKDPQNVTSQKQLAVIKTLKKGDVVIVSGALTHIDDNLKVNFASFYDGYGPWNIDLLLTDIRKKNGK